MISTNSCGLLGRRSGLTGSRPRWWTCALRAVLERVLAAGTASSEVSCANIKDPCSTEGQNNGAEASRLQMTGKHRSEVMSIHPIGLRIPT